VGLTFRARDNNALKDHPRATTEILEEILAGLGRFSKGMIAERRETDLSVTVDLGY
jgi:hypothetical protein